MWEGLYAPTARSPCQNRRGIKPFPHFGRQTLPHTGQLASHPPDGPACWDTAMKSDPAVPADQVNLLRQQLILAQVRIMELEDGRDELQPRLAGLEKLLTAAQDLTDLKLQEAAHLEKVRADLQTQYEHLRHMQHVTNEALNASRAEVAAHSLGKVALLSEVENLHTLTRQLADTTRQQLERISSLETAHRAALAESATRQERIAQLDAEQRAMKSSRSWRWTAWLRSLERVLGGRKP